MSKEMDWEETVLENYKDLFPPQTVSTSDTLKKAFDDEEIFALKAMDETSPVVILYWIRENFYTAPEMKLRKAFEAALRCKQYEDKRRAT